MSTINDNFPTQSGRVLADFQLTQDTASKRDPAYGKRLGDYIESTISGVNSYYWLRNNRFKLNRNLAAGKVDMSRFQDRLEFNGKTNFLNIGWQAIKIVNTIISRLVGRWMMNQEKIVVTATDSLSTRAKTEEYDQLEFLIRNKQMVQQLQQQSGVQMMPQGMDLPDDQNELDLWAAEYQLLPEEILTEKGVNDILAEAGFFDVLKDRMLNDSAQVGFVGAYTWMDDYGVIHPEWVKGENALYSYSEYNDLRDTTWRGQIKALKISELRKKYGQQFGGKLTEEEIWEIAQTAKEYQLQDKIRWLVEWNVAVLRPYDEWNIDIIDFELRSLDKEGYTISSTKNNSTYINKGYGSKTSSGNQRSGLLDNQEYVEDKDWNIYRGVYAKASHKMLEWGLKKNTIRPQGSKNVGNVKFGYSFYIWQNYDMRNVAVPEKVERPVDMMILSLLKIEQLVAKMRPNGSAINVRALREVDLGLADPTKPFHVKKVFDQTGDLFYTDLDAEGNPIPGSPITTAPDDGFIQKLQALAEDYRFHYQILKDELGEDPNLMMQAAKPRVTTDNIEVSQAEATATTDHMYDAYLHVLEDVAENVGCLLKDSVTYGSMAYRHLLSQKDVANRVFATRYKMLPTQQDIQKLEAQMLQAVQSNPDFILYCDTFKVMRMAAEDVKLAEIYFRKCQRKMIDAQQQQKQQDIQANAQVQQQSLQMKAQLDAQHEQMKIQAEQQKNADLSKADKEKILLTAFGNMWANGKPVPEELKSLESEIIKNVAIPLFSENQQNMQALQQQNAQNQQQEQPSQGLLMPPSQREQDQQSPDQSQQQPLISNTQNNGTQ